MKEGRRRMKESVRVKRVGWKFVAKGRVGEVVASPPRRGVASSSSWWDGEWKSGAEAIVQVRYCSAERQAGAAAAREAYRLL